MNGERTKPQIIERNELTADQLRNIIHYNCSTGIFTWLIGICNVPVGTIAGCSRADKCRVIGIRGHSYLAHRLAWLWVTGRWPLDQIDHINLDCSDNRWCNLREATCSQNHANMHIAPSNTSGVKGVCWFPRTRKWVAQTKINGRHISFGYFSTIDEARAAYIDGTKRLFGEFARAE